MSAQNTVVLSGHLARPVTVVTNKIQGVDRKVVLGTIAVPQNFKSKQKNGERDYGADFIPFRHLLPASATDGGVHERLTTKSTITVEAELRSGEYLDESGARVYTTGVELQRYPTVLSWGARQDGSVPAEVTQRAQQAQPAAAPSNDDFVDTDGPFLDGDNGNFDAFGN